jgi:hypothetical protein
MRTSSFSIVRGPDAPRTTVALLAIVAATCALVALMVGGALAAVVLGSIPLSIVGLDRWAHRRRSLRRYSVTKSELRNELTNQCGG